MTEINRSWLQKDRLFSLLKSCCPQPIFKAKFFPSNVDAYHISSHPTDEFKETECGADARALRIFHGHLLSTKKFKSTLNVAKYSEQCVPNYSMTFTDVSCLLIFGDVEIRPQENPLRDFFFFIITIK